MPWWATVALTVIIKRLAITLLLKIVKQIPNKWKRTFISSTKCVTPYLLLLFFRFFLLLPCSYKCPPRLSVNSNSPSPYQTSNSYWWPKFNNKYFTYDFSLGFTELYLYLLATSRILQDDVHKLFSKQDFLVMVFFSSVRLWVMSHPKKKPVWILWFIKLRIEGERCRYGTCVVMII